MANKSQIKKQNPKRQVKTKDVRVEQGRKVQHNVKNIKKKQADEKSARIKKARAIKKVLTWTILLGMIIGIFVFLCKSELFNICTIQTTGNAQINQETLKALSNINLGDNIFLSNTRKAEKEIVKNPYIKEVNITRNLPDKIKIEVVEKQKYYMIELGETIAYIDKNGYVLEISNIKPSSLIKLEGYSTSKEKIEVGKSLNEEDIERLEDVQKILKSGEKIELQSKIGGINIQDKNEYILKLSDNKKIVYIGDTSNLANKMLYLKAILEKTNDQEGKIFVNGNLNKGFDPYFREELNS